MRHCETLGAAHQTSGICERILELCHDHCNIDWQMAYTELQTLFSVNEADKTHTNLHSVES